MSGEEGSARGVLVEQAEEAVARAAAAVGISGLFLEVHEDPDKALSDGSNAVALGQLPVLLDSVIAIHTARLASNAP